MHNIKLIKVKQVIGFNFLIRGELSRGMYIVLQDFVNAYFKFCLTLFCFNLISNHPTASQIFTCNGSVAFVACDKQWSDRIIISSHKWKMYFTSKHLCSGSLSFYVYLPPPPPPPRLNIKTVFPRNGNSRVKDETVVKPSYLWHGGPYTGKTVQYL